MFLIPRRSVRTRQPQHAENVNWQFSNSLEFVFAGLHTRTKKSVFQPTVLAGTPTLAAVSKTGRGIAFSGGAKQAKVSDSFLAAANEGFTLEVLCEVTSMPSLSGVFTTSHFGASGNARGLIAYSGAGKNIYFWGASADLDSGVAWREDGRPQHVFVTSIGGSGTPMYFYRDGKLIASGTTPNLSDTPSTAFSLGDAGQGWSASPTGIILKSAYYRRALSSLEIGSLSENPWKIFEDEEDYLFIPNIAGGGGPASITGTLTGTLDSITTNLQASLGHSGTESVSLSDISCTLSGIVGHSADIAINLDEVSASFSGTISAAGSISGTLTASLADITTGCTGIVGHFGTGSLSLSDVFVSMAGAVAGTPEHITGSLSISLDGVGFRAAGNSGTFTLTSADIEAIRLAVMSDPKLLTVPKFIALK